MLACQLDGVDVILGRDWLKAEQPTIDWTTGTVTLTRDTPPNAATTTTTTATTNKAEATAKPTVEVMSTASMRRLLKKPHQLEHVSLVVPKMAENSTKASAPATAPEEIADILQQHQQLFVEPTSLPPKRPLFDHRITLIPDSQPAYRNYVRLSHAEAEELAVQLGTLLEKDFIKASSSPYGAPVLFVKKKDGSLRMCLDYRGLNHITTKDKYPLPNISDILDRVATAKVFSKMDLRAGYHQVRMADEDMHKTAFVTHMGSFEWRVLPMGLTNAPATFQRLMNSVLQEHHAYAVVYLDDILVFSQDIQAHKEHLKAVLASLEKAQLRLHKTKCEFGKQHVTFLGHTVGEGMLGMEKGKVDAVKEWQSPTTKKQLQSFLGFANFYRAHVKNFSHIAAPLTDLLDKAERKTGVITLGDKEAKAFQKLKNALVSAPLLNGVIPSAPKILYVDASDQAVGAVLHQVVEGKELPVAYGSRKLTQVEQRYPTRDKELLALVYALRQWRHHLMAQHFTVFSDHESLRYLLTMDITGRKDRLARWAEELANFDFELRHIKGTNNVADPLSRLDAKNTQTVEEANEVHCEASGGHVAGTSLQDMRNDAYFGPIIAALEDPEKAAQMAAVWEHRSHRFKLVGGQLYLQGWGMHNEETLRLCVAGFSNQLQMIRQHHEEETSGHAGVDRTLATLTRNYFWPHMQRAVKRFIRSCDSCQRTKPGPTATTTLMPITTPPAPGHTLTLDFMELPLSTRAHNNVLVIVDKFSKLVKIYPTTLNITAEEAADVLYSVALTTFCRLPAAIISDRDPRFTSSIWSETWKKNGARLHLTTAHRPQADGQTERANRQILEHLRHFVNEAGSDWDEPRRLAQAEFAINTHLSATTGMSAFQLLTGRTPIAPAETALWHVERAAATPIFPLMHEARNQEAQDNIDRAGDRMVAQHGGNANAKRFEVGDKVLLHTRNYPQHRANKLRPPFIGPFRITKVLSPRTVQLQLPDNFGIHNIINVDQLKLYYDQQQDTTPHGEEKEKDQGSNNNSAIEKILDVQIKRGKKHYLVRWKPVATSAGVAEDYWLAEDTLQQQCTDFGTLLDQYQATQGRGSRRSTRRLK